MAKQSSLKPTSKEAWAKANDAGPHLAALPTGKVVKFRIPDAGALLRTGGLPEELREVALVCAAHPDGPEGYFTDLALVATRRGDMGEISKAIERGLELRRVLVAEMLVEPEITAEEIEQGLFHEFDIEMLVEFAERRRSVDAAGNALPIITLDEWARFRNVPASPTGPEPGGANGHVDPGAVPDADAGDV